VIIGTAPRTRGQRRRLHADVVGRRNSPAYAGTTSAASRRCSRPPEQPRVCGDNGTYVVPAVSIPGTAPRTRGQHRHDAANFVAGGNSPACVGTTKMNGLGGAWEGGTALRAQGRHLRRRRQLQCARSSPACAGTTYFECCARCCPQEQPRVREDDPPETWGDYSLMGTAPRARGGHFLTSCFSNETTFYVHCASLAEVFECFRPVLGCRKEREW
jgi:hypothetical protein